MRNFGRLEVRYTSIPINDDWYTGGIWDIYLDDDSELIYLGGETEEISIAENAEAVLTGGRIDYITSYQDAVFTGEWDEFGDPIYDGHIDLIVKDYQHNTLTNLLTGTWADDTAFDIQLIDESGYDPAIENINFTIIPEPATLLLISLGAALIRKR